MDFVPSAIGYSQGTTLPRIRRSPCESQSDATRCGRMAAWNKWKGPARVKRRREGGRLCRERPLCLRQQRYGSHDGERRHGVGWPAGNLAEETFSAVRHFSTEFPFVRCVNHSPHLGRLEVNEKTGNH
jgi:hypothetical protein